MHGVVRSGANYKGGFMYWRKILEDMGFIHVEGCIYRWQGQEFNFSSRHGKLHESWTCDKCGKGFERSDLQILKKVTPCYAHSSYFCNNCANDIIDSVVLYYKKMKREMSNVK